MTRVVKLNEQLMITICRNALRLLFFDPQSALTLFRLQTPVQIPQTGGKSRHLVEIFACYAALSSILTPDSVQFRAYIQA